MILYTCEKCNSKYIAKTSANRCECKTKVNYSKLYYQQNKECFKEYYKNNKEAISEKNKTQEAKERHNFLRREKRRLKNSDSIKNKL